MPADPATARRTFAPVVLVGLAAAGLGAVAGNRAWAVGDALDPGDPEWVMGRTAGEYPLAGALSLVVLACWGVLLVTRGRIRRVVAVVGLLAAIGVLVTVAAGFAGAPDQVRDAWAEVGATAQDVSRTGWYWVALVAAVVSVGACALAVRWVPGWPAMGSRYDAPADRAAPAAVPPPEELSELELWKAMDEGRDPTALD